MYVTRCVTGISNSILARGIQITTTCFEFPNSNFPPPKYFYKKFTCILIVIHGSQGSINRKRGGSADQSHNGGLIHIHRASERIYNVDVCLLLVEARVYGRVLDVTFFGVEILIIMGAYQAIWKRDRRCNECGGTEWAKSRLLYSNEFGSLSARFAC